MTGETVRIGPATVDLVSGEVRTADGAVTTLRPKSAALLRALAERPGQLVTKADLMEMVWPGTFVDEDGLVQCVGEIRRALGPSGRDVVRTHARRGYSLHPDRGGDSAGRPSRWHHLPMAAAAIALLAAGLLAIGLVVRESDAARNPAATVAETGRFEGPVVAIFPFEPLAAGERWERLSRAITRDIIDDLAVNSWVHVLADATTRAHGPASPQAASRLGADWFVTGSVQADGETVVIAAALADARTGRQVWSKRVEGAVGELLPLQRAASEALVGELAANWNGPIARAGRAKARQRGIDDLGAYELYLVANDLTHSHRPEDFAAAAGMYRQVIALAPRFGEAWAQLSLSTYNMVTPGMSQDEMERLWEEGHAAGLEAYRVAPDDPHAIAQAANAVRWDDPAEAERMIRRAARLAPNNADMLAYLSFRASHYPALAEEAVGWIERAVRLNPGHPAWYDLNRGAVLMVAGRYAEATGAFARAPVSVEARAGRIAALALSGEDAQAREEMSRLLADAPDFTIGWHRDYVGLDDEVADIYARGFRAAGAPD